MRNSACGCGLAFAMTAGLVVVSAQQPAVFRSGVDLVRFDLSVTDANGRPLTDVRPDEIEIVEDGRPRPIVLFQRVQEPAGFYTDAAIRAVSAEVTNNEAAPRGHLYVLLFDQLHITSGNEQAAREAAERFIRTRVRASDRVAIFGLPGPGPDHQFTADQQRAVAELRKVHGGYEPIVTTALGKYSVAEAYLIASGDSTIADSVTQRLAQDLSSDTGSSQSTAAAGGRVSSRVHGASDEEFSVQQRSLIENATVVVHQQDAIARDFLLRLSDLMKQFKDVEGRKTIVLFSEGFHQANITRELQDVEAAAAQSYAVFYAMDLNARQSDLGGMTPATTPLSTEIQERIAPLASLALETDGLFVADARSQLDAALKRLADQSQDYYIAGFLPSEKALAARGSYQRVTVRVKRPGVRVSARTGYTVPAGSVPPDRRRAIDAALAAPFSQQALKVSYTTYVLRSAESGQPSVLVSLDADLPLASSKPEAADVVFVVRNARDGRIITSGSGTIPLPDRATPGEYLGRGSYRVQFSVPPGTYLMRAVVREPGGLLGSADRRLDVRDVAGPSVAASDLVLGSANGVLPVRVEAYSEDGLSGLIEIYGRTPEQLAHVKVAVALVHESDAITKTLDAVVDAPESAPGGAVRRARFSLPLSGVTPGAYVARAVVRDGAKDITTVTRQLQIVDGTAPPASAPPAADPRVVAQGPIFKRAQGEWVTAEPALAAHATKGFDLFTHGAFADAAVELEQAFDDGQRNAATAFVLGWAWQGAGDARKAIGAWRAAAAADPSLVPAHLAIADAYLRLSQPDLAVQAVRAGLSAQPDSVELKAKLEKITGGR
ncbi:MAG TPA: VWA domain-containing protein [Vicinamibacterales bacterium]|jgi:VWFA-related protein|nr:VWA domain-containing protein [Vicinamibacterales bacterium]